MKDSFCLWTALMVKEWDDPEATLAFASVLEDAHREARPITIRDAALLTLVKMGYEAEEAARTVDAFLTSTDGTA